MNITNTQFEFAGKTKTVLLGGMALGLVCLVLTFFGDDEFHTRFWSNFLHNSVYFTGISFMALAFMCAQITAFGGWMTTIKRIWEAMSMFIIVGIVLMSVMVVSVWGHLHQLYHWNTPGIAELGNANYDRILAGKAGFLNPIWYTVGTVGFLALWYFWATKIRNNSIEQDTKETRSLDYYKVQRKWAASFLPIIGFLVCVFIWQSVMSIDGHWYSTMFAWYSMISMLLGALSLTVLLIIYLKSKGYLEYVSRDHLHDVGKFLFGISVFWTYLWFDQFMLIWYANNGEETVYFKERMNYYPVLFWGNLLLNFITPFFILMRNDTKRKFGTMFFVACVVFFGHWWDFFYMIKPGARLAAYHAAHGSHTTEHEAAPIPGATPASHDATTSTTPEHGTESHGTEAHATEAANGAVTTAADHGKEALKEGASKMTESAEKAVDHVTEVVKEGAEKVVATATTHAEPTHTESAAHTETHEGEGHAAEGGHDAHAASDPSRDFKIGYTIPGLPELGIMIGFLSLFLFMFFRNLEKASLIPWRDPYLEESMHHETGVLIDSEQEEKSGHDHH
jgi:hypothetical protein